MKTKRAIKSYTCHLCKAEIGRGDQYARKSVVVGKTTIWAHGDPIPDWAWDIHRAAMPVCAECAK